VHHRGGRFGVELRLGGRAVVGIFCSNDDDGMIRI
jgi:hypothetical protein